MKQKQDIIRQQKFANDMRKVDTAAILWFWGNKNVRTAYHHRRRTECSCTENKPTDLRTLTYNSINKTELYYGNKSL